MSPPPSDKAECGSIELEDETPETWSSSYAQTISDPASHDVESVLLNRFASESLRYFLDDLTYASMQYGHTSEQEAVVEHCRSMEANIQLFKDMMLSSEKTAGLFPVYHYPPLNIFQQEAVFLGSSCHFGLLMGYPRLNLFGAEAMEVMPACHRHQLLEQSLRDNRPNHIRNTITLSRLLTPI